MTVHGDSPPPVVPDDSASPSAPQLDDAVIRLSHELRGLASDYIELASLETRLSVLTVLRMAIIAIVTAVMLVSSWLAVVGAVALGLISLGFAPVVAMLLVAAANLLLALVGWLRIRHESRSLGWAATQRTIEPPPVPDREGAVT
jgi:hypothetical protein